MKSIGKQPDGSILYELPGPFGTEPTLMRISAPRTAPVDYVPEPEEDDFGCGTQSPEGNVGD